MQELKFAVNNSESIIRVKNDKELLALGLITRELEEGQLFALLRIFHVVESV